MAEKAGIRYAKLNCYMIVPSDIEKDAIDKENYKIERAVYIYKETGKSLNKLNVLVYDGTSWTKLEGQYTKVEAETKGRGAAVSGKLGDGEPRAVEIIIESNNSR